MWNPLKSFKEKRSHNVDEHFVPSRGLTLADAIREGNESAVHHLIRYEWAAQCLGDSGAQSILDLATGSGYGAHELAVRLPTATITGVDYDVAAIQEARATYALRNLEYRVGDATRWDETIGPATFDAIVSFDMIEHVLHREVMLESLVHHLAPGGCLLLSTPCGHLETVLQPLWVHHRIEYSLASLYDFLRRYFAVVVEPDDREFPRRDVFNVLADGPVTYFLKMNPVVCRGPIILENPYRSSKGPKI
jgi:2-polyprenyl-3-methyl-5-hydroxy-6-metoxy-1,4-benzoquinol methylase